jgi:hypothetical protein
VLDLAEALDTPGWSWTTDPAGGWAPQTAVTRDGSDAARSGPIAHSQKSVLQTTVTGPGTLSFWWRVSCESAWDKLQFLGGGVKRVISGRTDWQQVVVEVPAGPAALQWTYEKDELTSEGEDAGWLDQVSFGEPAFRLLAGPGLESGRLRLTLRGAAGSAYTLETSKNLTSWLALTNVTLTQPEWVYEDDSPGQFPQRFYRAVRR